jgi:hypothetical protein
VIWRHLPDQSVWKTIMKAPFTADEQPDPNNWLSEKIRAMLIEPETGFLVVVGEREFKPNVNDVRTRAFVARFVPLGAHVGSPSTSPGDVFGHESMHSVTICGEELIAGGWTRNPDDPNATPQPLFRWASNGIWLEKKLPEVRSPSGSVNAKTLASEPPAERKPAPTTFPSRSQAAPRSSVDGRTIGR